MELNLNTLRDKMNKIKSDVSRKEGERTAILNDLKKEFNIEDLDKAYDLFDSLKEESKSKEAEKTQLMKEIEEQLTAYGY